MNEKTQKRLKSIINIFYIAIVLGLAYLFVKYCMGMVFPFLLAFFVAMIVQKPTNFIFSKTKKFKSAISTVLVLLIFIVIAFLISLAGAKIVTSGRDFVEFIRDKIRDFPTFVENIELWLLRVVKMLPQGAEDKLTVSITDSLAKFKELTAGEAAGLLVKTASNTNKFSLSSIASPIGGGVWSFLKGVPAVLIAAVVSIVASCFFASDYDRLIGLLRHQLSEKQNEALSRAKTLLLSTLSSLVKAYGAIMLTTFCEMLAGLFILQFAGIYKSNYIVAIAALTAVVDIFPVLGTGTVMVPWALYSFITGKISLGVGLLIIYVVILILRQIIEPKLVSSRLGLPPVVTLAGMYIGTQLFGVLGIFLMPILIIMVVRLNDEGILHIWKPSTEDSIVTEETPDGGFVKKIRDKVAQQQKDKE